MKQAGKCFLRIILCVNIILSLSFFYYFCYKSIPSSVKLISNEKKQISFKLPASGSIETGGGKVEMRLYKPVTVVAPETTSTYQMDVRLLGVIPLKKVEIQVIDDKTVYAQGNPVGIFLKTKGVMVVGVGSFEGPDGENYAPSKNLLQKGDTILSFNGTEVTGKKHFIQMVADNAERPVTLLVEREGIPSEVTITPKTNIEGAYKLGIWIRDNAQGVGTLTFIDANGRFGALGHGITDTDTGLLMELGHGSLYETAIVGITKSVEGSPGELTGMIAYDDENVIGEITENTEYGIFGQIYPEEMERLNLLQYPYQIALKQEVHLGNAQMITSAFGEPGIYQIQITKVHLGEDGIGKGLEIKVVDEDLIEKSGGIVQGVSGSPILQDGKIIGAVTHVMVDDPTRGYGIFIENMLQ